MKIFLNIFFVVLGVIFFIIILFGIYFYVADPLNLKPLLFGSDATGNSSNGESDVTSKDSGGPSFLSDSQQEALEIIGINPNNIPSEFTAEQTTCFEKILGVARVAEIKAGEAPTMIEYIRAKDCM